MNKRKIVNDFISKTAKNKIEEYAIIEEIGEPSIPTDELPNLKKDRIVLELVNRTNSDSIIDLFGLPAGVNTSQGIDYGDLFETYYCEMTIPITELGTTQTYTINWLDEDLVAQSATTALVSNIDELISELIIVTNDNWGYYIDGTNYIVHKNPILTYVY
jgi:hypothetical protein